MRWEKDITSINKKDMAGNSLLMRAEEYKYAEMVEKLMKKGALNEGK